jgi:hypothetical protein
MHEHIGPRLVEAGARSHLRLDDRVDRLQLAEVITAADRAERGIERRGRKPRLGEGRGNVPCPGPIERDEALGRLVDAQLAHGQIELEQTHAAADIRADDLRVNAIGQNAAADRPPFAGMQVRHGSNGLDAGQCGDGRQL